MDDDRSLELELVQPPSHEPVVLGDFVLLASGSPQGLVIAIENSMATVTWLLGNGLRSNLPVACLRPNAVRHR